MRLVRRNNGRIKDWFLKYLDVGNSVSLQDSILKLLFTFNDLDIRLLERGSVLQQRGYHMQLWSAHTVGKIHVALERLSELL